MLRTNTFGVNVALRTAIKNFQSTARHCNEKPENLGHVLGVCVAGKGMRIQRHEKMADIIATKCEERGHRLTPKSYSLFRR
jgi:hypothetical protein